jgi:hypothetical protein
MERVETMPCFLVSPKYIALVWLAACAPQYHTQSRAAHALCDSGTTFLFSGCGLALRPVVTDLYRPGM